MLNVIAFSLSYSTMWTGKDIYKCACKMMYLFNQLSINENTLTQTILQYANVTSWVNISFMYYYNVECVCPLPNAITFSQTLFSLVSMTLTFYNTSILFI